MNPDQMPKNSQRDDKRSSLYKVGLLHPCDTVRIVARSASDACRYVDTHYCGEVMSVDHVEYVDRITGDAATA